MSAVLGFDFYQGPEVPPPLPIDFTMGPATVDERRKQWAALLEDQVRYHDAWAILTVKPNTDVLLFDAWGGSAFEATGQGGTAHLLLARESPEPSNIAFAALYAAACITSVRRLHVSDGAESPFCDECGHSWPCATIRSFGGVA